MTLSRDDELVGLTTRIMVRLLVENVHGMIVKNVVPSDPYLGHLADFE